MTENTKASKKILVADDSLTIQKVIRLALSGDGYDIQTVSDGKEALEQISLFRPDICVIDVSLPQLDAYQLREQFMNKPDLKNIPVILMSSAFEKVDETRAKSLGFAGHLIKPFDPSHLRSTLLAVTNQAPENDPVVETINASPYTASRPVSLHKIEFEPHIAVHETFSNDEFQIIKQDHLNPMDDIQQMAKNTFDLSGASQHEWGMIEPGKIELTPESNTFENENSFDNNTIEVGGYDFDTPVAQTSSDQITMTTHELESLVKAEVSKAIEQIKIDLTTQIQNQMEVDLKKYARDIMPNLAERMIKEEIHLLLSEPPV